MTGVALADVTVHVVVNSLALNRGGLVKAVRQRAGELAETGRFHRVVIEVLGSQPWLAASTRRLQRHGHLHPEVETREVLSLLDPSPPDQQPPLFTPAGEVVGETDRTSLVMVGHRAVQRIHHRARKPARVTDLDDSGEEVRQRWLSPRGSVLRIEELVDGRPRRLTWVGRDDEAFLDIDLEHGEWRLPDRPMGEAYREAFDRAFGQDRRAVVVSEFRDRLRNLPDWTLDEIIARCESPHVGRIAFLHSNHRAHPYGRDAPVNPTWKPLLFDHVDAYDAIGVWTPAQKSDLEALTSHRVPIVVTPPAAPAPVDGGGVDPDRFIALARIAPKKGIEALLEAFVHVRAARPTARLEIYGFRYSSEYDRKIEAMIEDLGLADHVENARFVDDVSQAYRGAVAMLMTSRSEGFGLALLESCAFGVPPIAFDVDYGPRDVIVDGKNGFLVPPGDTETLAARAVTLAAEPRRRRRMGRAARRTVRRFDAHAARTAWLDLVGTALDHRGI